MTKNINFEAIKTTIKEYLSDAKAVSLILDKTDCTLDYTIYNNAISHNDYIIIDSISKNELCNCGNYFNSECDDCINYFDYLYNKVIDTIDSVQ